MKTNLKFLSFLIFLAFGLFTSCKEDTENNTTPQVIVTGVKLTVNNTLGSLITDNNGQTLYFFSKDVAGNGSCTEDCLNKWPLFYVEDLQIGSGLEATDFSEITRSDGEKQITYKGWPLYYFSPNADGIFENLGNTEGEAVNDSWFVAKPDYTFMIAISQLTGHDGQNYLSNYTQGQELTSYFTDGMGRTIYRFTKDYFNTNNFTAADFSNNTVWPIFYDDLGSVPSLLDISDFGKIEINGRNQVTYKGNPLYYFGQDTVRGENKGVSYPSPGVWPIVNTLTNQAATPPVTVKSTENPIYGNILTDGIGNSLYFFTKDVNGLNHCTGSCALKWPVFYTKKITLPENSTLDVTDFNEITLSDGTTKQTTYKGWPLYYFSATGDGTIEPMGETGGNGVNNVWYVAKETYDLMEADAQLVGHDGKNYVSNYTEGDGLTKYFTDSRGRTIYSFSKDKKGTNTFTASDFSNNGVWPIFFSEINNLPSSMNLSDFGMIDVFGQKQLTFKGWPLYYFGQDSIRGDNKGISYPSPGIWPVINNQTSEAPEAQ